MCNIIGYNQFPDKTEFEKLYATTTQNELAKYYGCGKHRINKWIKHFNLHLRPQGGGNNRKYSFTKDQLQKCIDDGLTNQQICDLYNMKISALCKWLRKFDIKRIRLTTEERRYHRRVRWLSEKNYKKYKHIINPNNYPRTLCGVSGGYQLDHIMSVSYCFKHGINIEECSSINNLQMITWEQNLGKRKF